MKNPLFYSKVIPLNSEAHRNLRIDLSAKRFGFAGQAHLIPAVVDEFGAAMPHLPIAFLPGSKQPAAVFVAGMQPGVNFFLATDGSWSGGYVPAYLRRYPFIVGDVPNGESVLCIDESQREPREGGQRLFSDAGEPEQALLQARDLATYYKHSADRTDEFCATLDRLNLLTSVTLKARTQGDGNSVVHGLMIVNEEAFDNLSADDVKDLHQKGFLKPIMQHLASLAAITKLGERSMAEAA
ncbi:SapC family protein [Chelativorans sp. Marseille-P2723]|uniref:SapC family protein n=1 Tax=Chelativorans sp. Marseille-P2723 TaxID=2709133 RepID=UPI00156FDE94|nr:SapC family protein [Chelativorans sp. Marseille-P2723]